MQDLSKSLNSMAYADLTEDQEERLKEMEKQFNNEFGKAYYFIVMTEK